MKTLTTAIMNAAVGAQRVYAKNSGYWLWHAPEFWLTVHVARGIGRKNWEVWCDTSPRKITKANTASRVGRSQKNKNNRFDIVVWHKADSTVKAIIEIKRAWSITSLAKDASKVIRQHNKKRASAKSGYLLVYSEARHKKGARTGRPALRARFKRWATSLGTKLSAMQTQAPRDENWAWGFALLRVF